MPFEVGDGLLFHDGVSLGSASALYADPGELPGLGTTDGVVHMTMPFRIDCVFVVGDKVVGCESKRPQDLVDSTRNRRLARQIRTLIEQTDIPTLLIRGVMPDFNSTPNMDIMQNLVCLQQIGVTLLPCPYDSHLTLQYLARYRNALNPDSRTPLSAIRGSDTRKREDTSLLRRIRGVGPALEERLLASFATPIGVLSASQEELLEAGASQTMAKRIWGLANENNLAD